MRHPLTFLLPLLVLVASACSSGTDEKVPVSPSMATLVAPREPVDPEVEKWFRSHEPAAGTRIVAGDRVAVSVQGRPELSVARDVPPNGDVPVYVPNHPESCSVNALGKTPQELEKEIAAVYQRTIFEKAPYVTVQIDNFAARSIYVVGAVKTQNSYPITVNERLTVLQALALAGGPTEQGDLRNVTLQRIYPGTGRTVASPPLDIRDAMERGNQRDNLVVEAGDTIVVPDMQDLSVQVLGNVEKPGSVQWSRGLTLARAITEAGSFKRYAKKDRIKIVRNGVENIVANFDDIVDGRAADLELEPRDVVWVDERWF
jgi:protein involved in polysaccharide export with SLBB domain